MNSTPLFNRYTWLAMIFSIGCLNFQPAIAAPLTLADEPLFLLTTAKSNLFFLFDNTGSMEAETVTIDLTGSNVFSKGVQTGTGTNPTTNPAVYVDICTPMPCSSGNSAPPASYRAPAYNTLYYDNNSTYKAWPGNPITCTFTQAVVDATYAVTNSGSERYVDLSQNWGTYLDSIAANAVAGWYDYNTSTSTVGSFNPLPVAKQQNFANWFCFHRTRLLAAKSAILNTINTIPLNVPLRVGINTYKNDRFLNLTDVTVNDPNPAAVPLDAGLANRNSMIASVRSWGFCSGGSCVSGTSAFRALNRAGTYFKCSSTVNSDSATSQCAYNDIPTDEQTCASNYAVMVTDGEYSDSATDIGGITGGDDNTTTNTTTRINPVNASNPSFITEIHYGSKSATLADLAMNLYNADFKTSIANNVPTVCGVDENAGQHLVTYGVSMGLPNNIIKVPAQPKLGIASNCIASTTAQKLALANQITTTSHSSFPITDLWKESTGTNATTQKMNEFVHATYNGRGKFFDAKSSSALTQSLVDIASDASSRRGASASVGLSGTSNTTGTQVFISRFYSGSWYGELSAYTLGADGTVPTGSDWDAHTNLDNLPTTIDTGTMLVDDDRAISDRAIITYNPTATAAPYAASFNWSNLTTNQKNDLLTDTSSGTVAAHSATIAQLKLNYIRGDHRCEFDAISTNTQYCDHAPTVSLPDLTYFHSRTRGDGSKFRLGDFINSSPVYVKQATGFYPNSGSLTLPSGETYKDFKEGTLSGANPFTSGKNTTNRTPMVYVGGNDGMLHAFNASNDTGKSFGANRGDEVFAFIPAAVYGTTTSAGLHKLAEDNSHISYVDLTPTITDAYVTTPADSTRKWRTTLVGSLRHGGKGVFAMDVTDPDNIIYDSGTTVAIGATREDRAAAKVMWEYSSATTTTDNNLGYTYSQPVVVPLRINNGVTPAAIEWFAVFGNGYNSVNGKAVLYLLKLSGPSSGGTWGTNDVYTIDTGVGSAADPNGLSSPALIDSDGDGIYDHAYAGDLYGNMWAFDLSGLPASWAAPAAPLFKQDSAAAGKLKPITAKPVVIKNSVGTSADNKPNVIVLFGTGRYLASGDQIIPTPPPIQSFYGVWDAGAVSLVPTDLKQQTIIKGTVTVSNNTFDVRTLNSTTVTYSETSTPPVYGWYMDLPDAGERSVSKPTLLGSTLVFSTIIPTNSPCGGGGSGWLMAISPFDGHAPGISTFDVNGDGIITAAENTSGSNTIAAIKDASMTDYTFASGRPPPDGAPAPCSKGSAVQGVGNTSTAGNTSHGLCADGGTGTKGRYSWRQLGF